MAGGSRRKQWYDLRFDLNVWAPEANAWGAGKDAGQMQREGAHNEQEEERFDRSTHLRHKKTQAGGVQAQDQARPT
jgi:hypothetical protein